MNICICDNFSNRLYREVVLSVTELTKLTVSRAEAGGKPFWVGFGKRWNVSGYFSPRIFIIDIIFDFLVSFLEVCSELIEVRDGEVPF